MELWNKNIDSIIKLTEKMIKLADKGDIDRRDTDCGIMYGVLRDCGYKLKKMAEEEKENHIKKGWWK
jgi:hypothetical protein